MTDLGGRAGVRKVSIREMTLAVTSATLCAVDWRCHRVGNIDRRKLIHGNSHRVKPRVICGLLIASKA